jgi:ABC-type lipoprotein export system ATPase subunit
MSESEETTSVPILEGRQLHKTYRLGRVKVPVLKGASVSINQGEWVAILGASGSGKSTLLHLLGGLDRPDSDGGSVLYQGERVALEKGSPTNTYRNRSIGFVFQFYHLLPELDVMQNAMLATLVPKSRSARLLMGAALLVGGAAGATLGILGAGSWGLLPVEERTPIRAGILGATCAILGAAVMIAFVQLIQSFLARRFTRTSQEARNTKTVLSDFGLDRRVRHRPRELSGGERQRVAIARALGSEPAILLADEPTGNLDVHTGKEILDLLKKRHDAGLTIVMVTHDSSVAAYADRVVHLEDGSVVEHTQPDLSRSADTIRA